MYRELFEEVGLSRKDVRILASTRNWLRYKLPKRLVRWDTKPVCIGQKQKWFLLQLVSSDAEINMQTSSTPEFDGLALGELLVSGSTGGVHLNAMSIAG